MDERAPAVEEATDEDVLGRTYFGQYVVDLAGARMRPPIAGNRFACDSFDQTRYRTLRRYQYDAAGLNEREGARGGSIRGTPGTH